MWGQLHRRQAVQAQIRNQSLKKVFEKAIPEDVQYVVDNWGSVRRHISNPYKTFLQDARFSVKGENTLFNSFLIREQ